MAVGEDNMKDLLKIIGIEVKNDRVSKKVSTASIRLLGKDVELRTVPSDLQDEKKRKQRRNPDR